MSPSYEFTVASNRTWMLVNLRSLISAATELTELRWISPFVWSVPTSRRLRNVGALPLTVRLKKISRQRMNNGAVWTEADAVLLMGTSPFYPHYWHIMPFPTRESFTIRDLPYTMKHHYLVACGQILPLGPQQRME